MKKVTSVLLSVFILAACSANTTNQVETTTETTQAVGPQTTKTGVYAGDYRTIFLDGKYPISKSRGITSGLATATNVSEFENGLMDLSKLQFSPNEYYFLEGQFIDSKEVNNWLKVQSHDNPTGLNTTTPGQKDVIVSILEQDYMKEVNGDFELNGMSIGIGLNPQIHSSITLTDEQLLEIGRTASAKILEQLRQKEGMANIPIVFGLFKQSVDNGLSRGVYLESTVATDRGMGRWTQTKVEKRVFPVDSDMAEEYARFAEFKKNIEAFFPNLNGVVAESTFVDGVLSKLNITITTQFFGQSEIIGLSQYIIEQASVYNRANLKVVIQVQSVRGTEAVISKNVNDTQFHSAILR